MVKRSLRVRPISSSRESTLWEFWQKDERQSALAPVKGMGHWAGERK
jgi:hypothetical protein